MNLLEFVIGGVGGVLSLAGFSAAVFGWLFMTARAFKVGAGWGLLCLLGCGLYPFPQILAALVNWKELGRPFLVSVLGFPLLIAGQIMIEFDASPSDDSSEEADLSSKPVPASSEPHASVDSLAGVETGSAFRASDYAQIEGLNVKVAEAYGYTGVLVVQPCNERVHEIAFRVEFASRDSANEVPPSHITETPEDAAELAFRRIGDAMRDSGWKPGPGGGVGWERGARKRELSHTCLDAGRWCIASVYLVPNESCDGSG